ncbi:MAG: long-chain-fatty-acid--CoA ligase [Burkholderiaceae bacterium]
MPHPWLDSYPAGVPQAIDPSEYASLVELLEQAFKQFAARDAYVGLGKRVTFAEVDSTSRLVAAWLQSRGLVKGDRVAIMMPNVLQYPMVLAGALRAGLVVVNVNPLYTARELEHQLRDAGAKAIFILENFAGTLQQVLDKTAIEHVVVTSMGDPLGLIKGAVVNLVVRRVKKLVPAWRIDKAVRYTAVLAEGAALPLKSPGLGPDDLAFLQYTGGTTGVSKGAMLSHRNIVANVLQSAAWSEPATRSTRKGPMPEQAVHVCALPLYHIFALTVCCLLGIRQGALVILIPNPRDLPALVKEIEPFKVTHFPAVNTLYNALLHFEPFRRLDFSQLRVSNGGGMAVQEAVARQWFELTGCPIVEGYGLSETSPSATCNPVDAETFSGTIGLPLPSTEIAVLDEDGAPVGLGEVGEIAIRGPQVMVGYWQRPDETARVMTADGFFKSGDMGQMDERGYLRIVDRKKDMILVSGFNVYPTEIEQVVQQMPKVFECAAIGVPDARSGEAVKLFVVRKDPSLTEQEIAAFCAENLTAYKRPRSIEFRDDLPKSNVGKILRRELRDAELSRAA